MDMHIGSINVSIRSLALSFHLQSFAILLSKCQAELIWGCKTAPRLLSAGCILFSPGPPTSKRHPVCNNFPDIFLQHPQKTNIMRRSLYYSVTCPWSLSPESFWHFTLSWCDMHWSAAPSVSCLNRHEYFNCTPHLKLPHFMRISGVYREISHCHHVKWLATKPSSQSESASRKKKSLQSSYCPEISNSSFMCVDGMKLSS